jgi:hypothetical protein
MTRRCLIRCRNEPFICILPSLTPKELSMKRRNFLQSLSAGLALPLIARHLPVQHLPLMAVRRLSLMDTFTRKL